MAKSLQDIELQYWERLRKGDAGSLAWLYDRYFRLLYNYGRKISADDESLEDGIHDVFVDLWRFRENLSPTSSVRFYLYRSFRRRLVRNKNSHHCIGADQVLIGGGLQEGVPCEEENIIHREAYCDRVTNVRRLLRDLSPRQYEAMILRFYDELSFEEIGTILNVNEQSARNLVQRGLSQLKQYSKLLLAWACLLFV